MKNLLVLTVAATLSGLTYAGDRYNHIIFECSLDKTQTYQVTPAVSVTDAAIYVAEPTPTSTDDKQDILGRLALRGEVTFSDSVFPELVGFDYDFIYASARKTFNILTQTLTIFDRAEILSTAGSSSDKLKLNTNTLNATFESRHWYDLLPLGAPDYEYEVKLNCIEVDELID